MITQPSEPKHFTLDELCALTDLPKRTVRYYIQIGLVDRPVGETRAAYYSPRHLEQLLTIRKWTSAGLSLDRVRELMTEADPEVPPPRLRQPGSIEVCSHIVIAEGIELVIEPSRSGLGPEEVRRLLRVVMDGYTAIARENSDER